MTHVIGSRAVAHSGRTDPSHEVVDDNVIAVTMNCLITRFQCDKDAAAEAAADGRVLSCRLLVTYNERVTWSNTVLITL